MADVLELAKECGFTHVGPLDPATLEPATWVRDTCAADKCHAYGHNWTCPPACGTLEECTERMKKFSKGVLLQTVGELSKTIDVRAYAETEENHRKALIDFAEKLKAEHPDCLVLGAGGCRICRKCAYPEPCKFPEKAMSSMEGYGLFVTQVCRDNGMEYNYGPMTIAYTGCALFNETE